MNISNNFTHFIFREDPNPDITTSTPPNTSNVLDFLKNHLLILIGIAVGTIILVIVTIVICCRCRKRRSKTKQKKRTRKTRRISSIQFD